MKLIVNPNRIMAALVKNSYSRKIILEGKLDIISINISEKQNKIKIWKTKDLINSHL